MAICFACGAHRPDGTSDCPGCRSGPVLTTPEMVLVEARLRAEGDIPRPAPTTPAGAHRLVAAAVVVGAVSLGMVIVLTLARGLLRG